MSEYPKGERVDGQYDQLGVGGAEIDPHNVNSLHNRNVSARFVALLVQPMVVAF
tara:strand:+ start:113 stop:274 length:162 start_codon:yes stop_codon:yes gene_type:complete